VDRVPEPSSEDVASAGRIHVLMAIHGDDRMPGQSFAYALRSGNQHSEIHNQAHDTRSLPQLA
jgi:hypothetical protein